MKAKHIKRIKEDIFFYKKWLPIINENFGNDVTLRDCINDSKYFLFVINYELNTELQNLYNQCDIGNPYDDIF